MQADPTPSPKKIPRRSSTGRSTIIETCIQILNDASKPSSELDMEEFSTLIINNTLPAELRSIAWRIFLNILPRNTNDLYEWVITTNQTRSSFEKINNSDQLQPYIAYIRGETNTNLPDKQLSGLTKAVIKLANEISLKFDFFKSQIVQEGLIRLFLVWYIDTPDAGKMINNQNFQNAFSLLASLMYSLYPSILHLNTDQLEINSKEDVNAKSLFYYLNSEEMFDADVYGIFKYLMSITGAQASTDGLSKGGVVKMLEKMNLNEENKDNNGSDSLKWLDRITYYYVNVANEKLCQHLINKEADSLVNITYGWYRALFTNSISFENIIYVWDNLFCNSSPGTLDFFDFIVPAMINNISQELMSKKEFREIAETMVNYPQVNIDLKGIILKAFKLKEKLTE